MPYIEFSNPVGIITSKQLPQTSSFSMKSLFSNNSLVCYKDHSLPSGGIGTVKNSRRKSVKT